MRITFKAADLRYIYKALKLATAKEDSRPIFQTIQLNCINGYCTATASEGYRLHSIKIACDCEDGTLYIPVVRIPKTPFIIITDTEKDIVFDFICEKITVKKIDGTFPDFSKCLPQEAPQFIIGVNPKFMRDALDSFSDEAVVRIEFFDALKHIIVRKNDSDFALVLPIRLKK